MSLKRGLFYTLLAQAPTLVLYFVASTVMTRMLGDVGRGEYTLITNLSTLLAMLMSLNIGFGVTYFISKQPEDRSRIIGTATTAFLLNALLVPVILWVIAAFPSFTDIVMPDTRIHWAYWAFVYANVMLSLLNTTISSILLGHKRFNVLNWMSLLNAGLSAGGMLTLFLLPDPMIGADRLPAVLIVSTITVALVALGWCALYLRFVRVTPRPILVWSVLRPMVFFSLIGHLSNLINLINYRFDVWVVDQYRGAAELGLYAVAVGVAQLLFNIPEPFSRVVQPYLFGQKRNEMLSSFRSIARINFTVLLALASFLALIAPWLVPFLFGDTFAPSVRPLRFLLPGIVLSGAAKLLAQLVIQGGLQHFNLLATTCAAVITITLDLLLIPIWGIDGAAIATTISYGVVLLIILATIRWKLNLPIHDLFLMRWMDVTVLTRHLPWKTGA
jgi:O-antigen/teichoic acid export membrane protein